MQKQPSFIAVCALWAGLILLGGHGLPAWGADEDLFITVQGSRLMVGSREFFGKGADYIGGRYVQSYFKDGNGFEYVNEMQMYHDFSAPDIENEIKFLKVQLGINVIRLITPSQSWLSSYVTYHGWDPWFLNDGSINPLYLGRLQTILSIAKKYGIRVQLAVLWGVQGEFTNSGISPGSAQEIFYKKYLTSLVTVLKDDPTVLSFELGNETLLGLDHNGDFNYWTKTGYEALVLSFTRRMITHIRSMDSHHLIASGEVVGPPDAPYNTAWWWPTPEAGMIDDVDSLNGGQAYSLGSLVDYWAPHMYIDPSSTLFPDPLLADKIAMHIREHTSKPVILGEMGYMKSDPRCEWDQSVVSGPQLTTYQRIISAVGNHLNGSMAWDPFPQFTLVPGQFSVVPLPPGAGYPGECPYAEVIGPPARKLRGVFPITWQLFSSADLSPLPAAAAFKQAYMSRMLNDSRVVSLTAPSEVSPGAPFQATAVIRNTGTTSWTTEAGIRLGSQAPQDNLQWGTGRVYLTAGERIEPGETKTFTFNVTAPSTPGTYNFQWRMLQENVEWFGDFTTNIPISVQAPGMNLPGGFHDGSDCTQSYGWACDADDYSTALRIDVYANGPAGGGGTYIGSATANQAREPGVGALCGGNSSHGFVFPTPVTLQDGNPHTIYAYAINIGPAAGNPLLGNSPKSMTCSISPSPPPDPDLSGIALSDLASVRVFPNPFRAARGDHHVTFDQMPAGSTVKLFTVSGRWVKTLTALTGAIDWDLTNDGGEHVSSGVYLYLITDTQGNKSRGKLTLIR